MKKVKTKIRNSFVQAHLNGSISLSTRVVKNAKKYTRKNKHKKGY